MKQLFCLLLAACMMASLCACGKDSGKDARNDASSSNEESSASAESIPTPKEQETPGESEQPQASADGVDVDLTVLSSTMVYSEVYNMLYNDPAHYLGKTVKARGGFSIYQFVTDGVLRLTPWLMLALSPTPPPAAPRAWSSCRRVILPTPRITRSWGRRSPSSVNFSPMRKTG